MPLWFDINIPDLFIWIMYEMASIVIIFSQFQSKINNLFKKDSTHSKECIYLPKHVRGSSCKTTCKITHGTRNTFIAGNLFRLYRAPDHFSMAQATIKAIPLSCSQPFCEDDTLWSPRGCVKSPGEMSPTDMCGLLWQKWKRGVLANALKMIQADLWWLNMKRIQTSFGSLFKKKIKASTSDMWPWCQQCLCWLLYL